MSDFFATVIGAALSVSGGFAGFWLQRRFEARQQFLAVTAEIRAEIVLAPDDCVSIYAKSAPRLARAVQLCRPFVTRRQFVSLQTVWREYTQQSRQELDESNQASLLRMCDDGMSPAKILHSYLDRFDQCIADCPA